MFRKSFAIAIFAMIPTASFAQADQANAFDGFFVGAQAGWGHRSDGLRAYSADRVDEFKFRGDSFDYGVFAGYDMRMGDFVVGAEAGIGSGGTAMHEDIFGTHASIEPQWNFEGTVRAGYVLGERTLAYARAGYGAERLEFRTTETLGGEAFDLSDRRWSDGLVVGGGIEYSLTPQTTLRGDYRYKDFDGWFKTQQLLLGASYRF
jgi:outer membrane immunogenic protein